MALGSHWRGGTESLYHPLPILRWKDGENVQSMYQGGKAANVIQEMKRPNMDIFGCRQVRWLNSGHYSIDQHHLYYSRDSTSEHSQSTRQN